MGSSGTSSLGFSASSVSLNQLRMNSFFSFFPSAMPQPRPWWRVARDADRLDDDDDSDVSDGGTHHVDDFDVNVDTSHRRPLCRRWRSIENTTDNEHWVQTRINLWQQQQWISATARQDFQNLNSFKNMEVAAARSFLLKLTQWSISNWTETFATRHTQTERQTEGKGESLSSIPTHFKMQCNSASAMAAAEAYWPNKN